MGGWDSRRLSWLALAYGAASVVLLSMTVAMGLWLRYDYGRLDAGRAWDDIDALQADVENGIWIGNFRPFVGLLAFGMTFIWLAQTSAAKRRIDVAVLAVSGLGFAALWVPGRTSGTRLVLELAATALAIAVVTVVFLRLQRSPVAMEAAEA